MDLVVAGQDDSLIDQLSFKLPSTSSYATERRLVSAYPSGASLFSPNGVRVARFTLTSSEGWLDPSTLRLCMKLHNTSATDTLQLASGPWCLFSQLRLLIGGVEVERIAHYGRQHELFRHLLMPNDWNIESSVEDGMEYNAATYPQVQPKIIGPGQTLSLNLTPLLGILQCGKYLPLRYMGGMTLEFTLADAAAALHPNSVSQSYNVEQASMRMATVRLDSALESSFSSMMLQGKKTPIQH